MGNDTILATISDKNGELIRDVTINMYSNMLANKDKVAIAEIIYHRFYGRYIKPFLYEDKRYKKHYKNGFSMMASSCLIIEALEAFYQGWEKTEDRGVDVFGFFSAENRALSSFKKLTSASMFDVAFCTKRRPPVGSPLFALVICSTVARRGSTQISFSHR